MKLKTLSLCLLFLILSTQIFSQPRREREQFLNHVLLSEIYKIPSGLPGQVHDSTEQLYYIYKIPYSRLVFEKNDNLYTASYRLTVEVHDSVTNTIDRKIKEDKISVADFNETDDGNIYSEGLLSFQISKFKKYNLLPILYDKNSDRELRLSKIVVLSENKINNDDDFLEPVVIDSKQIEQEKRHFFVVSNYEGCIPFSNEEYNLLIPAVDTSLTKIFITLVNDKDTVFSGYISESVQLKNSIEEFEGKIILNSRKTSKVFKNFIIPYVNKNLAEGDLKINISKNEDSKHIAVFHKRIIWFNRPISLINPELSIKLLKYMESDTVIDSLLDFKKKDYTEVLFRFWKRFDPTPGTSFNELMNEYYSRIDYTIKNFSSISGKRGFDTDRGRIFILYGKPFKLERGSDQFGKVVETWIYKNPERKFVFIDDTGLGEYKLKNS